jgi:hypothetical protein
MGAMGATLCIVASLAAPLPKVVGYFVAPSTTR